MAGQQPGREGSQVTLYALAGLLAAAFLSYQSSGTPGPTFSAPVTPTATTVSDVEGAQGTEPSASTAPPAQTATPAATGLATKTPAPSSTPEPTATSAPPTTSAPPPTQAPPPPTAEPTAEPTPSGPVLRITGPASTAAGTTVTFSAVIAPDPLVLTWTYLGQVQRHVRSISMAFPSDGCYTVELEGLYADNSKKTAALSVAVGAATCQ